MTKRGVKLAIASGIAGAPILALLTMAVLDMGWWFLVMLIGIVIWMLATFYVIERLPPQRR